MKYLPSSALDESEAVMEHGEVKHPGDEWKTVSPDEHLTHALQHIKEYIDGVRTDHESGRSPLAHAACRLLFIIDLDKHGEAR